MPKTATANSKKLEAENKRLLNENTSLKQKLSQNKSPSKLTGKFWRKLSVFFLVSLAGALLIVGNVIFWAGRTVVNTDSYVATVGPLIEQPEIQKAVAKYTTDQIYSRVDIQAITKDVLPPKAEFLAPTLSTQITSYTQTSLEKLLASEKFQTLWVNTQRSAHEKLITGIKNYEGDGSININDIYQNLSKNLADTKLSFLAGKTLPDKVGSITVVDTPRLPAAHNLVVNLPTYRIIAILALIASSVAAVWISIKKRKTVILLGALFATLMFISLIGIRVTRLAINNHVQPAYQAAASEATKVIFHPLVIQTATLFLASLVICFVAWVSGPTRLAESIRKRMEILFSGHVHQAIFSNHENSLTRFVGQHKVVLHWTSVGIFSLLLLMARITFINLVIYLVVLLLVVVIIEILAAPKLVPKKGK